MGGSPVQKLHLIKYNHMLHQKSYQFFPLIFLNYKTYLLLLLNDKCLRNGIHDSVVIQSFLFRAYRMQFVSCQVRVKPFGALTPHALSSERPLDGAFSGRQ
jgi:hypothetical protein